MLDTSAFIQGFDSSDGETMLYTTPLVLDEIRDEMARMRVSNWEQTGKLVIQMPNQSFSKYVFGKAQTMGEARTLSKTDHSVLALTHQLTTEGITATLVSDDYSVQNVADKIGLQYRGMNTQGIKRRFTWIHYCPGCRKQYVKPQLDNVCPICGTELKRKPSKKTSRRAEE